jgi:protein-S-isoprenylcysteine O-methyltransferase Ste14
LGFIGIGFQIFIMYARTPLEEKILIQHFGNDYESYIKTTGAFFPKFPNLKQ